MHCINALFTVNITKSNKINVLDILSDWKQTGTRNKTHHTRLRECQGKRQRHLIQVDLIKQNEVYHPLGRQENILQACGAVGDDDDRDCLCSNRI